MSGFSPVQLPPGQNPLQQPLFALLVRWFSMYYRLSRLACYAKPVEKDPLISIRSLVGVVYASFLLLPSLLCGLLVRYSV